jgi:hypothetical protein
MNLPFIHVSLVRLIDLLEGHLPPQEQAEVKAHLEICKRCTDEMRDLEHLLFLMRSDRSSDAPPILRDYVVHLYTRYRPSAQKPRRILPAQLIFNSARPAFSYGTRTPQHRSRQLFFSTGEQDIDLRLEPVGQKWLVSGQVLGQVISTGTVALIGPDASQHAEMNEQSEFVLKPVDAGTYQLILHLEQDEIRVEELVVGAQYGPD